MNRSPYSIDPSALANPEPKGDGWACNWNCVDDCLMLQTETPHANRDIGSLAGVAAQLARRISAPQPPANLQIPIDLSLGSHLG